MKLKQEDIQLLLKDLCARLPYGVKVHYDMSADPCWDDDPIGDDNLRGFSCGSFELDCADGISVENIKPYLRPMSSMTEEEQKEFGNLVGLWKYKETSHFANCLPNLSGEFGKTLITEVTTVKAIDWLNSHHFDYRGLIEKGLALEAPEDMYDK